LSVNVTETTGKGTELVARLWNRDETVLADLAGTLGKLCGHIAMNVLHSREDTEEVLNDTWLRIWESIPPNRPGSLAAYAGRITRNLALNRYRHDHAARRDRDRSTPMEELTGTPEEEAFFLVRDPVAGEVEAAELSAAIADFLRTLPKEDRVLFVRRYWRMDGPDRLAEEMHMTPGHVRVKLHRIRERLKKYLEGRELL